MPEQAAGLFLTHERSPRISQHFDRLVAESAGLIEWTLLHNEGRGISPSVAIPHVEPAVLMPPRYRDFLSGGGLVANWMDLLFLPFVLELPSRHVWVMEYDVDFSGSWGDLFQQFADTSADLITSAIRRRADSSGWAWWASCKAPDWVDPADWLASFHPLMRWSRDFAAEYAAMMRAGQWGGHPEFTIPTAAAAIGASIEDLGPDGGSPFAPPGRQVNYVGEGSSGGTFNWRPVRDAYFHEAPEAFDLANRLYHPVKPGVVPWEVFEPDPHPATGS